MLEAANRLVDGIDESGNRIAVQYSAGVLEEVRRLAVDGFNALSHGGVETGGILYGIREADCIRVLSFAELLCEHASGPRFVLSEKDRSVLTGLLQPPDECETVGWFRSHTRGDLELDDHDRELFERHFAQPMSVALILKPTHWGPASAAFFVREHRGGVLPASSGEFVLEPLKPQAAIPVSAENETSTEAKPSVEIQPGIAQACEAPPTVESMGQTTKPRRAWAWAFCVGAVLATAAAFIYGSHPPRQIELRAQAIVPGQVKIQWNCRPKPASDGASGVLEIEDGDSVTRLPLDSRRMIAGTVTYIQLTGHIRVRASIEAIKRGDVPTENTIDFIGPPASRTPPDEGWRDARPVEAEVAAMPAPPARGARDEQSKTRTPERPILTPPPARPIPKSILVADASAAPGLPPPLLPNPPALAPGSPGATGLPEFLSIPALPARPPIPPASSVNTVEAGRLIWTGVLARLGVIELEGSNVSIGSATGALPGTPLSLRVSPAEFTRDGLVVFTADRARNGISEAPSKANGWNAMHFRFDQARAGALVVLEAPNPSNDFNRLVVRNQGRDCSVVVVDWKAQ